MMLEAQFGSNISAIERPRLPSNLPTNGTLKNDRSTPTIIKPDPDAPEQTPGSVEEEDERTADLEAAELSRLRALGIPFPGVEIKVDKHVARVWLENLEVECANPVMRDRVRVVVERAVETVAGMWTEGPPSAPLSNGASKEELKGSVVEAKA